MKIQGSVAIVTGGAQGIGKHICRALLSRGGKVAIFDVDQEKGTQLQERLQKQYGTGEVKFITCDVTSESQMTDSFKKTKEAFGQINIVCNNAGVGALSEGAYWERVVDINLKGVIRGQFLGIQHMGWSHGGTGGAIVNVASLAAILPMGSWQAVYTATKSGVMALSKSCKDLKETEGIRVNCICPGFTNTKMVTNPQFLASESSYREKDIISKLGLISPEEVASGVMQLIEDENYNAAVMTVTKTKGIEILEKWTPRLRKSNL